MARLGRRQPFPPIYGYPPFVLGAAAPSTGQTLTENIWTPEARSTMWTPSARDTTWTAPERITTWTPRSR